MLSRVYVYIMCFLVFAFNGYAQPTANIQNFFKSIHQHSAFRHAIVGFCLLDAQSGNVLASNNKEVSLLPASTLKLLTTSCALEKLGASQCLVTTISYSGKIESGRLEGDFLIKGGGDPALGSSRFGEKYGPEAFWAAAIKALTMAGISSISGQIYADAAVFEEELVPPTWIWLDMGNYFGAGASGLTFNENIYQLVFKPGKRVGDTTTVLRTEPETGLVFKNYVTTSAAETRDMAYITGAFYSNYRSVTGTIPMGKEEFRIKGSLSDPPQFVADELKRRLALAGIACEGTAISTRIKRTPQTKWIKLDSVVSPTVSEIVNQTNLKSVNLFAEHLLKLLGLKMYGLGSTANGLKVVEKFVNDKTGNSAGIYLADGSGLALNNLMTAHKMTEFLAKIKSEPWFETWLKSLPVAGKSGTVSGFCKGTAAEGKVWLKSGTMQRVKAYAGYVKGKSGNLYPFAIFVNNYFGGSGDINKHLEQLMVEMVALP